MELVWLIMCFCVYFSSFSTPRVIVGAMNMDGKDVTEIFHD